MSITDPCEYSVEGQCVCPSPNACMYLTSDGECTEQRQIVEVYDIKPTIMVLDTGQKTGYNWADADPEWRLKGGTKAECEDIIAFVLVNTQKTGWITFPDRGKICAVPLEEIRQIDFELVERSVNNC